MEIKIQREVEFKVHGEVEASVKKRASLVKDYLADEISEVLFRYWKHVMKSTLMRLGIYRKPTKNPFIKQWKTMMKAQSFDELTVGRTDLKAWIRNVTDVTVEAVRKIEEHGVGVTGKKNVHGKDLEILRAAVADYMYSEGCSCCQHIEDHRKHKKRLAELLNVPAYDDGSGYDFPRFTT